MRESENFHVRWRGDGQRGDGEANVVVMMMILISKPYFQVVYNFPFSLLQLLIASLATSINFLSL